MSYWTIKFYDRDEEGNIIFNDSAKFEFLYNDLYISWINEEIVNNDCDTYTYKDMTEAESIESEISINANLGILLQKIPSSTESISLKIECLSAPDGYNLQETNTILSLSPDGETINMIQQGNVEVSVTNSYNVEINQFFYPGSYLPGTGEPTPDPDDPGEPEEQPEPQSN